MCFDFGGLKISEGFSQFSQSLLNQSTGTSETGGAQGSVLRIPDFFSRALMLGGGYLFKSVPHYRVAMEEFVHSHKGLGSRFRV